MGEVFGKLGVNWVLLIAQIVNFTILLALPRAFLYRPILNMLAQRRDRIAQSMKDTERVAAAAREAEADKANILEEARREAQEVRAKATRDAEKIAQEVRSRAEQDATDIRIKAQEDAKVQVETTMADANKQIADLAIQATEKLLGQQLADRATQERFVTDFLQQNGSAR